MSTTSGILVVDKPAGWTSHDVVARVRRLAGTKRVGHAGTLDPMATGVLVVGVGRATRVLGYLTRFGKAYEATIRIGQRTATDDAEGEVTHETPTAGLGAAEVCASLAGFTGEIEQVPPRFSAVKVDGVRSYARARRGERADLPARTVTVSVFEVLGTRRAGGLLDVDAYIECSSGTYVRALARDLGDRLGVGGHLTALRRIAVGPYRSAEARTPEQLAESLAVLPLGDAVAAAFPRREVSAGEARRVAHGGWLPTSGDGGSPVGVFGPDGTLLALMDESGEAARPLAVFAD